MSEPSPAVLIDRGGIWPVPFERAERVLLTTQAKHDRRNIPALWLWRILGPDNEPGGTAPDETLWVSPRAHRRYAAPVPIHLYVDWTPEKKGKRDAAVETTGTIPVALTRAEARRLGVLIGTRDDAEGLAADLDRTSLLYIPRAGDVFLVRGRHYEVQQFKPEWWGATDIVARWMGTAAMLRDDITAPALAGHLPAPPSPRPPLPAVLPWRA